MKLVIRKTYAGNRSTIIMNVHSTKNGPKKRAWRSNNRSLDGQNAGKRNVTVSRLLAFDAVTSGLFDTEVEECEE